MAICPFTNRRFVLTMVVVVGAFLAHSATIAQAKVGNPQFDEALQKLLSFTVPLISVDSLAANRSNYMVFDVRAKSEYQVSHITDAAFYETADLPTGITYDTPIVLYCSVGYRSEKTGEELIARGYTRVYNLYGSIFEWVNSDLPIEDHVGQPTDSLHVYSQKWSKWVNNPRIAKIW